MKTSINREQQAQIKTLKKSTIAEATRAKTTDRCNKIDPARSGNHSEIPGGATCKLLSIDNAGATRRGHCHRRLPAQLLGKMPVTSEYSVQVYGGNQVGG